MTQPGVGVGERPAGTAGVKQNAASKIARLVAQTISQCDATVSLGLIVLITLCALFDHHAILRRWFTVDDSWSLDLFFKAHQGTWLGRSVVFTYGPVYQWLLGIPSFWGGASLGSFFRFGHLGLFAYTILVIFAATRLLLRNQAAWRRALFILGLAIPWTYFEVRGATVLLLFALLLRLFDRNADSHANRLLPALAGSAALTLSFLVSSDSGIYGIVALIIVAGSYCICGRPVGAALRKTARFSLLMGVGLLFWSALVGALLGFHYWTDTKAVASTYRWAMAIPFTPPGAKWDLWLVLGICCLAFGLAWWWRESKAPSLAGQPVFLLAAPLFSLACLQSAIIRSDWPHLVIGWFPAVALAGCSLFAREVFPSRRLAWGQALGGFALLTLYICPRVFFVPDTVASALAPGSQETRDCPVHFRYFDGVCVPDSSFSVLHGVASYLQTHSAASDSVAIFPVDNVYGNLAGRLVAGGVLQNYVAAGDYLVRRQLQGWEKQKPALAVYSADEQAVTISGVPNLTRNPDIWLYLQSHYRTVAEIEPGVVILRRDDARSQHSKAQFTGLTVNPAAKEKTIGGATEFDIANQISWPANTDLIRIRLRLHYPPWWTFGKPWSVSILIGRADGTTKHVPVLVPPNRETDVWVYPGHDALLASYFSADPAVWGAGRSSPVTSLALRFNSMDWGSVRPRSVSISRVEAVSLAISGRPAEMGRGAHLRPLRLASHSQPAALRPRLPARDQQASLAY